MTDERRVPELIDAAADWFALQRSGQMSAQAHFEFEIWLEGDPAHLAAYKEIARSWALAQSVATDPEVLSLREEARGQLAVRRRLPIYAGGVVTAIVFGVLIWASSLSGLWNDVVSPVSDQHFHTAVGETRSVILSDGSAVTLDSDTELGVHETWRARTVTLVRGQSFFLVARDQSRPFTVWAAGNAVTATGTAFNVRLDPDQVTVVLAEGRLHLSSPSTDAAVSEQADLLPGWQLVAYSGGERRLVRLSPERLNRALGWRTGQLAFVATPLSDVAAELNRYSIKKIILSPALASVPIDGVFREGDVDGFVRILEADGLARVENVTGTSISLASIRKRPRTHAG